MTDRAQTIFFEAMDNGMTGEYNEPVILDQIVMDMLRLWLGLSIYIQPKFR